MFCCSPIPGRWSEKQENLWDKFVPQFFLHFMTFSSRLETNVALQCSSDSFAYIVINILCVDICQNYILTHSCLPMAGRLFYYTRKLHGPRIRLNQLDRLDRLDKRTKRQKDKWSKMQKGHKRQKDKRTKGQKD